jgi:hypothetical protein
MIDKLSESHYCQPPRHLHGPGVIDGKPGQSWSFQNPGLDSWNCGNPGKSVLVMENHARSVILNAQNFYSSHLIVNKKRELQYFLRENCEW